MKLPEPAIQAMTGLLMKPSSAKPTGRWYASIAFGLPLLVFVAGVAVTLALTFVAGEIVHARIADDAGPTLEHLASQVALRLEREVTDRVRDLQLMAARPGLWVPTQLDEQRRAMEALQASGNLAWIGFIASSGAVQAAAEGVMEQTSVADERWFVAATDRPEVTPVHDIPALAAMTGGSRFITVAVPVMDVRGNRIGVLAAHLYWSYSPQASALPADAARRHITATIYSADRRWLLSSAGAAASQRFRAPSSQQVRRGHDEEILNGEKFLGGFAHSAAREFANLNWLVAVRQPAAAAFAPVSALRMRLIRWGVSIAFLAALPAAAIANKMVRRFRGMAISANRILRGEVTAELPRFDTDDELGAMSTALADMTDELRRRSTPATEARGQASVRGATLADDPTPSKAADLRRVVW